MIKPYPGPLKPKLPVPSKERLEWLVANEMGDAAQTAITEHELPYIIVLNESGKPELRSALSRGEQFLEQFITVDPDTIELKKEAFKMSATPYSVLVSGETGTGKELISNSQIGKREGPIKTLNCSGFPRELIESMLFGHTKGSFTGAASDKDGLLTSAKDGLVFLDEIGDLPMEQQAKLLRAIQYKRIMKVGSNKEEEINCKFVCATNKDLHELAKNGLFREDLYARLSQLELHIKSLRDRKCDIIPIAESMNGGKEFLSKYGDELAEGLLDLRWNVRSIENYIIRYQVLGRISKER